MAKRDVINSVWFMVACLVSIGIGIGWLIGLSVSPVVSIVLTSVTGSLAAIVAALGGLDHDSSQTDEASHPATLRRVNPLPLAVLVFGIVIGSIFGLVTRNNQILGSDVSAEIAKWSSLGIPKEQIVLRLLESNYPQLRLGMVNAQLLDAEVQQWVALGIPKEEVVRRVFAQHYPENPENSLPTVSPSSSPIQLGTYLFDVEQQACATLLAAARRTQGNENSQVLINALLSSTVAEFQSLPEIVPENGKLKEIVEKILCPNG